MQLPIVFSTHEDPGYYVGQAKSFCRPVNLMSDTPGVDRTELCSSKV